MDLSDFTRAVTPSLDGQVLSVLASAGRPLTAGEVASQAARGSEIGIRKCLARLVEEGIVRAVEMGRNRVHELNRQHIAAAVADGLAGLRIELLRRFRAELESWEPHSVEAWLFGSAARGDGDADSDIDLLLVRQPRQGEVFNRDASPARPGASGIVSSILSVLAAAPMSHLVIPWTSAQESKWHQQVDQLHGLVRAWTGNPLQVVELSLFEVATQRTNGAELMRNIAAEGIPLIRQPTASSFLQPHNASD